MSKAINIGLIGLGTVGSGVVKILKNNSSLIKNRTGIELNLKKVCSLTLKNAEKSGIEKEKQTTDFNDVINDKEIDIVVELIGGYEPAKTIIMNAMKNGKHIVSANKAVIARYGPELFEAAQKNKVNFYFEAAVGGCIPILNALQVNYQAERINAIYGILNGTTNYILTKMSEGKSYEDALKEAQELGFAEKDPSFDVEGKDAAQKLVILASLAFNMKIKEDIFSEGITKISRNDMQYAKELGYAIKLLTIAKKSDNKIELRVHPTMIPAEHELATVKNELNAIYLVGENIGPVMLYGKGAGQLPTAAVVLGDILSIANNMANNVATAPVQYFENYGLKSINEVISRYYFRFMVVDAPGVLAKIAAVLGNSNISIAAVSQKEENKDTVPVIITTHDALESNVSKAIKEINKLDVVKEETVVIRIEDLAEKN
ncbi:MAG: homoserine dehydrogenase [Candidatus Woesearchaeota archaeon]|nr:homoserine dehydrogenase [Candidatus Woesearchaeota archaeon]